MKTKLIFNPHANLGRARQQAESLQAIAKEKAGVDWEETTHPKHAIELARCATEDGYELIVALGGDGTNHEVLNGIMQAKGDRKPWLGVVPVGSGNDFSYAAGIDPNPANALRQVLNGSPHPVDAGYYEDNTGHQAYWVNAIGLGIDTLVTIHSRKILLVQGFALYFAAVLQTIAFSYYPFKLQAQMDGLTWEDEMMMLVLCNGKREGGGFQVAPESSPIDGKLNWVGVQRISRFKMLQTIPYFTQGTQAQLSHVRVGEFKTLEITASRPLHIHVDGEIYAGLDSKTTAFKAHILPRFLQIVR